MQPLPEYLAAAAPAEAVTHVELVDFWTATGLMVLGVVVQFVFKMAVLEDAGNRLSPLAYLRAHVWRSLSLVLGAWLFLYICHAMSELTRVTAVLIGFGCEQANDWLRAKTNARLSK